MEPRWTRLVLTGCAFALASRADASTPRQNACSDVTAQMWRARESQPSVLAWPRPLDRVVSLDLGDMPLGRALEHVATRTGVHLSYSPDLLPLQRDVCLSVDGRPLGAILVTLLSGTGVAPVVVGNDQVVLAPTRTAAGSDATPSSARSAKMLERVVVTGTATGGPEKSSPFAISIIERPQSTTSASTSLSAMLDGAVPGLWMWTQSPTSALARYGSIRGASSFGESTPKVYIDGIEVANPLVLTALAPTQVERIEVIRGPQGAALYGSDAISGVVNIITRHDGSDTDASLTETRASAGSSASDYSDGGVVAQDYSANVRSGSSARSASLALALSTIGAFVPGASSRQFLSSASVRHVGSRIILTGTGRFDATNAETPPSPLLPAFFSSPTRLTDSSSQRVRQYTLGGTGTFQSTEEWTHALTLGIDGYRLSGVSGERAPVPSTADSALRAASGAADRLTLRYSSSRSLEDAVGAGSSIAFGLEHSTARELTSGFGEMLVSRSHGPGPGDTTTFGPQPNPDNWVARSSWWSNTGIFSQGQLAFGGALFLTGGLRIEQMSGPAEAGRFALLPMSGASWVQELGLVALKLRAAYGRGIRPARTVAAGVTWSGGRARDTLLGLDPEEQSGTEGGIDLSWGSVLEVHATRFDQRASGLVQPVAILGITSGSSGRGTGSPEMARVLYQLQNVGAIDNAGWELQATSSHGPLAASATMTIVSSRVARLATGYRGDLREGDRMLEVPARTMGLHLQWSAQRWSINGAVARAADWVNYDQVALASTIATDPTGRLTPVGAALRAYWKNYSSATHLTAGASFQLGERASLMLTGANLLNQQTGQPDNATVVPGRTVKLGLRNTF